MKVINKIADILVFFGLSFVLVLFSVLLYVKYLWPYADYEQIMSTLQDTSIDVILDNAVALDFVLGLLFFIITFPLCYFFLNRKQQIWVSGILIIVGCYISGFIHYHVYSRMKSTLYEDEYVKPQDVNYKFPDKKRNLLLIYLESFENSFSNEALFEKNLISELSKLQQEGQFSYNHSSLPGADFSVAAIVSSQCAIPLRYDPNRDIWDAKFFMPGAVCFPQILKDNGYQVGIIKAADITYTSVNLYANFHGYDFAEGVDEIKENYLKNDYEKYMGSFGGVTDRTLYEYAKVKLNEFDKDKPFMLTLFSLDTHMPSYYLDKECKKEFGDLRDAFICSDKGVAKFIEWFKNTPYWENTTVVVVGDHLLPSRIKGLRNAKRGIFNMFLNVREGLKIDKNKIFSTYDLAPTILEALNIEIKPRKFGLGRSMFSDTISLVEKFGSLNLKLNLIKKSEFYSKLRKPNTERKDIYRSYKISDVIKENDVPLYTDAIEKIVGRYFVDRMYIYLDDYKGNNIEVLMDFVVILGGENKMVVSANGEEVKKYEFSSRDKQPYKMKLSIDKNLIKDNKLLLKFRNKGGVLGGANMGISILSMKINEQNN